MVYFTVPQVSTRGWSLVWSSSTFIHEFAVLQVRSPDDHRCKRNHAWPGSPTKVVRSYVYVIIDSGIFYDRSTLSSAYKMYHHAHNLSLRNLPSLPPQGEVLRALEPSTQRFVPFLLKPPSIQISGVVLLYFVVALVAGFYRPKSVGIEHSVACPAGRSVVTLSINLLAALLVALLVALPVSTSFTIAPIPRLLLGNLRRVESLGFLTS